MNSILGEYGLICIQRDQANTADLIAKNALMSKHISNIHVVDQWMNDITSSTALRFALSKGFSIRFLTPDPVIDYIYKHDLYDAATARKSLLETPTTKSAATSAPSV